MSNQLNAQQLTAVQDRFLADKPVRLEHAIELLEEMPTSFTAQEMATILQIARKEAWTNETSAKTGEQIRVLRFSDLEKMCARKGIFFSA